MNSLKGVSADGDSATGPNPSGARVVAFVLRRVGWWRPLETLKAYIRQQRPPDPGRLTRLTAGLRPESTVTSTHGERPLMGVVLGSTPYKLLHRSPVPVLVVRVPDA